jgi:hypothetical protein
MTPYARTTVSEEEHAWFLELAAYVATYSATSLARGTMRLGQAHKYLISTHFQMLMEGMGEEGALEFLDQLVADMTTPIPPAPPAVAGESGDG